VARISPFITPNADFYRIDTALTAPQVSTGDYTLRIHGMVGNEIELSYDELLRRPMVERDITLTCVSNEVGGHYAGNARWLGTRLDDLLREAGVQPGSDQVVGRSVDGFACGFPVANAMDGRDALVVVGMNGEPLPIEHGFPVRLVVPGLYGFVSATKWLTEIELTTFAAFDHYWLRRGWAQQAPIKLMSRIDTPRGLGKVAAGTAAIGGVAWAQHTGIAAVEVQIDDGPWQPATLGDVTTKDTWRQWMLPWEATSGRHTITVRATDANGAIQTSDRAEPIPDGASGLHQIVVIVR
jgi:DMSO/TMAO reductase YedYZ molybdopterin-dependent catalytic subunit